MLLALAGLLSFPLTSKAGDSDCGDRVPPGVISVVPAKVVGAANEHLVLTEKATHVHGLPFDRGKTLGYLITGDKVEVIESCDGYTYVHFHGKSKVSYGWVDSNRIESTGKPYLPLPANAAAICDAAETQLNASSDGTLEKMHSSSIEENLVARLQDEDGRPLKVTNLTVGGRAVKGITFDTGGTCESTGVEIWNSSITERLSPADVDERSPINNGSNGALSGFDEDIVQVAGRPMLYTHQSGLVGVLSLIGKDGDVQPTCKVDSVFRTQPLIKKGAANLVCASLAQGKAHLVDLHEDSGVDVKLGKEQLDPNNWVAGAGGVSGYEVLAVGDADLQNTGHLRKIARMHETYSSGAGCGSEGDHEFFAFVGKDNLVDLGSQDNESFIYDNGDDHGAAVAKVDGKTYIVLSRYDHAHPTAVWLNESGEDTLICDFESTRYRVTPINGVVDPSSIYDLKTSSGK